MNKPKLKFTVFMKETKSTVFMNEIKSSAIMNNIKSKLTVVMNETNSLFSHESLSAGDSVAKIIVTQNF